MMAAVTRLGPRKLSLVALACALTTAVAGVSNAVAQTDSIAPPAPENMFCPGPVIPDLSSDQFIWQDLATYPTELDYQGPRGVAVDRYCNTYIARAKEGLIDELSSDGELIEEWGSLGSAPGQLKNPGGVSVDSLGNIYVADTGNNRIEKFSNDGQLLGVWGKCLDNTSPCQFPAAGNGPGDFFSPNSIVVDGFDNVYVADVVNNRVEKLTTDGTYVTEWGGEGTTQGKFRGPFGLAVDQAGYVYVTDAVNERIQKFTPQGDFVAEFGNGAGSDPGQFQQPRAVAVDIDGNMYVADYGNSRIQELSPDGDFIAQWRRCEDGLDPCRYPNIGSGPGEFAFPQGLTVDGAGQLFVADTGNDRVQLLGAVLTPTPSDSSDSSSDAGSPDTDTSPDQP